MKTEREWTERDPSYAKAFSGEMVSSPAPDACDKQCQGTTCREWSANKPYARPARLLCATPLLCATRLLCAQVSGCPF